MFVIHAAGTDFYFRDVYFLHFLHLISYWDKALRNVIFRIVGLFSNYFTI